MHYFYKKNTDLDISHYQKDFIEYLASNKVGQRAGKNLYTSLVEYIIKLGGKRMRPVLTLMAADIFSGGYEKAMPAALS